MIEIITLIILIITFILFKLIKTLEEIRIVIELMLLSATFFYIAFTITNEFLSKFFAVLGIISIILIPLTLIIYYIQKLK